MVTTQVLRSPHRYLYLNSGLLQRCKQFDLRCNCLQDHTLSCEGFYHGCGDVATSRAPMCQVGMFGGKLAAGAAGECAT